MTDKLVLYTISTAPYGSGPWLHIETDELYTLGEELEASTARGRIAAQPLIVTAQGELDDAEEHYGEDEIAAASQGIPLPYESLSRAVLVAEELVVALEQVGAAFRAHPVTLVQPGTDRTWSHWLVTYALDLYLPHLRDDREPVCFGREEVTIAYYSQAARDAIAVLGWSWMTFKKHELPRCVAAPIGDSADADRTLVTAIGALFLAKKPRATPGSGYAADYFVDRLLVKHSDATPERVRLAIERSPDAAVYCEVVDGALDAIGVKPESALARKLGAR